jgi:hypothetical protein
MAGRRGHERKTVNEGRIDETFRGRKDGSDVDVEKAEKQLGKNEPPIAEKPKR